MPEDYLLGNQALYLFAYNKVQDRVLARTGCSQRAGAKTTLKALASVQPEDQARARSTSSETYTNEFVEEGATRSTARKK